MNKIIDIILKWWLRSGRYRWSLLRRWLCERGYLKIPLPTTNSLKDVEACLKQIKWKKEGLLHLYDSISYPQTTWAKKKDDCDGFASLAAELLYRLKPEYRPVLITTIVRPIYASHTVCAFNNLQGSLWFFDNNRLKCEYYQTYAEIATEIGKRGKRMVCWDVRNYSTFDMIEFHIGGSLV